MDKAVDTLHTVETPEGALLQIAVAGPVVRGMAWLVDGTIRTVILIILGTVVGSSTGGADDGVAFIGIFMIAQFLLNWFYSTTFEAMTGTTPGKKAFGLWVVHDNATPITLSGALVRNFLRVVDSLPFFYMVGLICMMFDNRFRRLGDLAAGTLVIYRDKAAPPSTFVHDVGTPPPEWLSRDQRQSIVDFAERCSNLSADRQSELASVLSHLIEDNQDPVHTLKSWAQWILRGQSDAQSTSI